jgi:predicted HicB family RNase H-like nuclease
MNLSGARGASPVLRVRIPSGLLAAAEEKAARTGESLPDVVREHLRRWAYRKQS